MRKDVGQVFRIEDYRPSDYLIPRIDLTFDLQPGATRVTSELVVERAEGIDETAPLRLDGDALVLDELLIDGAPADPDRFEADGSSLVVTRPPKSRNFRLTVVTTISPDSNSALMGLYLSNGVYCTQCEAEGFRRITYFLDRPDVLSVYTVRIEADRATAPVLLSNGNPGETGELPGGRHYAVWHDPHPKPSYLFALVAGDLGVVRDSFTTMSGRHVDLGIYVEHGKEARAAYAMDALKRSMRWDEEVFGCEYDLDIFNIVAVSDFNMGAMENKGLNIFNDKYVLADEDTATDIDFANIEAIIAHEYFHNWTGNRITCRDWFQLCLKEGLTVYRDHEFSADQRSRGVERIMDVRALRAHQFPEDQGPLAHPVRPRRYREINNFYTATVYEKGAEVVRMIATILGREAFRAGMDLYFDRHDGQAVTIEDFLAAFEDASGEDLSQFALWYHQAGTPSLAIASRHDPADDSFVVEVEQSVPPTPSESRKRLMHIPLAFGLIAPDGSEIEPKTVEGAEVERGVIHIRKRKHMVRFKHMPERPQLSLNRGFSAPVTIAMERQPEDLLFLASNDSDQFARWEALNTLLTDALLAGVRSVRGQKRPVFEGALVELLGRIAGDETLEPAYRSLALTLPSEADLARELAVNIDPQAIHVAREKLTDVIATSNDEEFADLYRRLTDDGPFNPDAASAGRRSLRNTLMGFACVADGRPDRASEQFDVATNMTDRAAALTVLVHRFPGHDHTREALARFEQTYRDNPLVLDKWLQIQASAPGDDTLQIVRSLTAHPSFSIGNPNRVRALIGSFATLNQTGFHRADGAAYRFFAETVLEIDRGNPQLAARLATALRSWKSLEPARQEAAREALLAIAAPSDLSTDLRDIVERTLA